MPGLTADGARQQIERLVAASRAEVNAAQAAYVRAVSATELRTPAPKLNGEQKRLERILFGLETVGHDLDARVDIGNLSLDSGRAPWQSLLWPAYRIRRTLTLLADARADVEDAFARPFEESLDGVLANRQPELRLHLGDVDLSLASPASMRWEQYLAREARRCFLLLVRKDGGRADIDQALSAIGEMRERQQQGERELEAIADDAERATAAARALALYNCVAAVELAAKFIAGQTPTRRNRPLSSAGIKAEIDHFVFNAREILSGAGGVLRVQVGRLGRACKALIDASVHSQVLPPSVKSFIAGLAGRPEKPVLELWYAQREAVKERLLDPTRSAVVISLPTSSGKTLLAEMAILQAHHDAGEKHIAYLAPTKALVTQTSLTLKRDLGPAGVRTRVATPAFELDAVENELLTGGAFDVLVTTPEKLDLLVKLDHPAVADLSLVVVDEAHTIADEERGARLELLLAMLRREREDCRFLLMTPFADNAHDIARWLGDDRGASIVLDWKPNDRVVGVFRARKPTGKRRRLVFESLDTPHSDCPGGVRMDMKPVPAGNASRERLALWGTHQWAATKRGGVLLLARSRRAAQERAEELARMQDPAPRERDVDVVCRYLETEVGGAHPLAAMLEKGVAFHHAGLSPDARYLIERLVEKGRIAALCATTTLAHGVHFPLSAVVIESCHRHRKRHGRWISTPILPWEFWNIVGRAGRALEDPLGSVAFAAPTKKDAEQIKTDFLSRDANRVVSTLMEVIQGLQGQELRFGLEFVDNKPAVSAFLQYLLHAVSVSGESVARREVELLLRASFAFSEAQRTSPQVADELVRIARAYLDELAASKGEQLPGFAKIADGTGFSSPSVDMLWRVWRGATVAPEWRPDALFSTARTSETLVNVMRTLGSVPEVKLGNREEGTFSPERVARITSLWVNGVPLTEIAQQEYGNDILECCRHLYTAVSSLVPWGMTAVQKVAFSGAEGIDWPQLELLPAMVLHGVRSRAAIAMCMLNVPRFVSEKLGTQAERAGVAVANLDSWLDGVSDTDWQRALPVGATISGAECRLVWRVLDGRASWDQLSS